MMRRRQLLALSGAAVSSVLIGCGRRPAESSDASGLPDVDDEADSSLFEELTELHGERVPGVGSSITALGRGEIYSGSTDRASWSPPPLTPELERQVQSSRYWALPDADRPAPEWPRDDLAPDYGHLLRYTQPTDATFELTADTLKFLAERNSFSFTDARPVRIIGLRGCALESGEEEADWAASHRLRLVKPDHIACSCLVGVWRPSDDQIAFFRASTAPAVSNMFKALRTGGAGTSLLPTGLYSYRAGTHKRSQPARSQPGALLIDTQYVVLRTPDDLRFDPFQAHDVWTRGAAHNIHSAGEWSRDEVYDSAGCQVVRGKYDANREADGPWSRFRIAAGTVDPAGAPIADEQYGAGTFQYMLLTGQEAALYAKGDSAFRDRYRRLRPGSQGDAVRAEKDRLRARNSAWQLTNNDRFDMWMSFAVLQDWKAGSANEYVAPLVVLDEA